MNRNKLGAGFGGGDQAAAANHGSAQVPATGQPLSMDLTVLEVITGRMPGARLPLNRVRLILGRHNPPHLTVDLDFTAQEMKETPMVSRRHAEFSWEEGRLLVRDLGSTNGTFVNGERLASPGRGQPGEPRELRAGDLLRVANIELRVLSE